MSNEDEKVIGLVPSPSSALSRVGSTSLVQRGMQDWLAAEDAERWLKKGLEFSAQERHEEAFACFQRGIELNPRHPELLCYLADAYHMGRGVQEDDVQAVALYRRATEQGNVEGQVCLGWHYCCGEGVPLDYAEAAKWWRMAADQGNDEAQLLLAATYKGGFGVQQDYSQAIAWFRKAAEQGNTFAQSELEELYAKGYGGPQTEERYQELSPEAKERVLGDLKEYMRILNQRQPP